MEKFQAILMIYMLLQELEKNLLANEWLAGDLYSLADIAFTPYFYRLQLMSFDSMWENLPHLSNWYGRIIRRDSMAEVIGWYTPASCALLVDEGRKIHQVLEKLQA